MSDTKQRIFKEIFNTRFIIQNLEFAKEVMKLAPVGRISLSDFKCEKYNECGTLYCAYGWIQRAPYFQALGFSLVKLTDPGAKYSPSYAPSFNGSRNNLNEHWERHFGPAAYDYLFTVSMSGFNDKIIPKCNSQRDLAIKRFEYRIKDMESHLKDLRKRYAEAPNV